MKLATASVDDRNHQDARILEAVRRAQKEQSLRDQLGTIRSVNGVLELLQLAVAPNEKNAPSQEIDWAIVRTMLEDLSKRTGVIESTIAALADAAE